MATQYIVIAGAAPALHRTSTEKVDDTTSHIRTKIVKSGEILDENYFKEGELAEMIRGGFVEEYEPYKLTEADIEVNAKHPMVTGWKDNNSGEDVPGPWKVGVTIHANAKGFKKAEKTKAKKD